MALKLPGDSSHPQKWSASDPWVEVEHTPGAYPPSPQPQNDPAFLGQRSLAAAVGERRQEYIRRREIKIKVGTWNVASISSTHKDLASWFVKGLGAKGLHQDLSGLSATHDSDYSSDDHIESVEHQESRAGKKTSTVPAGEVAAVSSDNEIGLYVLGLQEVVDISSLTEAMRPYYDPNPARKWKSAVKKGIPQGYVKIAEQQLLGLLLLVYAAPEVAPQITSVDSTHVGTGALGYVGNKGAVSVRVVLGGTTRLLFVNCHLAAGADQASLTRRIWDTNQILLRTKFEGALLDGDISHGSPESIGDEDVAFWFGDLNYRLDDIPGEDVRRLLLLHTRNEYDHLNKSRMKIDSELGYIPAPAGGSSTSTGEEHDDDVGRSAFHSSAEPTLDPKNDPASLITTILSLLKHDQLRAQQRLRKAFHDGWREGEINFLPTYKYDVGSVGMFDSGEKKRSPSWCDRILYRTRQDRLNYEQQTRQEAESTRRDEQMRKQGLDKAAEEQEVLFDYDPTTDGAYDYEEYDENEDNQDSQPVVTSAGVEDVLKLEDYISHQRVLSSDHKPLSAVFNLAYDGVVPELKAQVQQEVARMLDKNENETRPSVTVVVDNPPEHMANADRPTGGSELNSVEFGEVRYNVPKTRTLTIANTGPISATFAFIDRPVSHDQEKGSFPSWVKIEVHHENQPIPQVKDDLGTSVRFDLSPGDVVTVDITVQINKADLVYALNEGIAMVDDILVLRILDGRDHFISIKGSWIPTCFFRYLDELVRFPQGVRSGSRATKDGSKRLSRESTTTYHSAPKELFELSEAVPTLVERTIADWAMTNRNDISPWRAEPLWPFRGHTGKPDSQNYDAQLTDLREALDTVSPLLEHFNEHIPALGKAELVGKTLVSFLQSLQDGIIPTKAWQVVDEKLTILEKSKSNIDNSTIQEIAMEALSMIPVHSVSLTFVTFMLNRTISEICSDVADSDQAVTQSRHTRSSTDSSQAPSEISSVSIESTSSRSSFLPSLTRRRTGTASTVTGPTGPGTAVDEKQRRLEAYAEFWSSIVIRSERDNQAKGKDRKTLDARKKRVMLALLDCSSM